VEHTQLFHLPLFVHKRDPRRYAFHSALDDRKFHPQLNPLLWGKTIRLYQCQCGAHLGRLGRLSWDLFRLASGKLDPLTGYSESLTVEIGHWPSWPSIENAQPVQLI